MSAQTEPVDVLAVMDADASVLRSWMRERNTKAMRSDHPEAEVRQDRARYLLEQHHEARAAVAELIEAASEVDRLSRDFSVWDDPESVERAVLRQRAALARVQGGAA